MLLRLPNELLHTLIEHMETPSHAALAQTCHALHDLTTPHLYRSANIQRGKSNEFIRTISTKYADQVRHIAVIIEGRKDRISPCRIVPCLERLPNLQSLTLDGGYWMWDDKSENGEKWDTYEGYLWDYLERASLKQPAESRIAGTLRSLTLDRTENNNQAAFLHSSCLFVIPQLHDLTIRGFMLNEEDGEVDEEFQRQTELESLRIERSFVNFLALKKILLTPRALRSLSIGHAEVFWHHELQSAESNEADVPDFVEALLPHCDSLEEVKVVIEKRYGVQIPTVDDQSFREHAARFSMLKRWLGCDRYTLRSWLMT